MDRKIVLIGGFSEIIELCNDLKINEIYVIDRNDVGYDTIYLGRDENINDFFEKLKNLNFCITPDLPIVRRNIFENLKKFSFHYPSLFSSSCKISKSATIGVGSVVQNGAYISTNVVLGTFVKVNVNACIMHDSKVGSYTTIAPSCTILGRVTIGEMCYIGASATILPELTICDNVVIGSGAVVTKTITESGIYAGVPARKLK
jgi:sugar O-acyltransferase (sialic acid O-acetyltransferase NeuD family)